MKLTAYLLIICGIFVSHSVQAQHSFQSKNCKFSAAHIQFKHTHPQSTNFGRVDWSGFSSIDFVASKPPLDLNQIHWSAIQQFDLKDWIKKNKSLVKNISHGFITCPIGAHIVSWNDRDNRYQIDHYQLHSSGPEIEYVYNKETKKSTPSKVNYSCVYLNPLLLTKFNRTLEQKKIECAVDLISPGHFPLPPVSAPQ